MHNSGVYIDVLYLRKGFERVIFICWRLEEFWPCSLFRKVIYIFVFKKSDLCYRLLDCRGVRRVPLSFRPFLLTPFLLLPMFLIPRNAPSCSQGLAALLCSSLASLQAFWAAVAGPGPALFMHLA